MRTKKVAPKNSKKIVELKVDKIMEVIKEEPIVEEVVEEVVETPIVEVPKKEEHVPSFL